MSEQPSKSTKPSLNEQIADVLVKVLVTGSGTFSLYYLVAEDMAKAIIAGGVAFGASLMTNFWQGFGGILNPKAKEVGEEAGKVVEKTITEIASRIPTDFPPLYQQALKTYCYSVEVEGFQNLPGLPLKDIFVPLHIESAQNRILTESPKEIWDFLPQTKGNFPHRRIAVVGKPGYGKTTLMRHLAYVYVTNPPENTLHFLPILLRFREIYDLISVGQLIEGQPGKLPELSTIISQHLAKQPEFKELKPSRQWLENNLKQGKCLVIFDGLDEVPRGRREVVREWVDKQMKAYRNTQFILTSRPYGFELKADDPSHTIITDIRLRILDFTNDQKEDFINKWYRTFVWTQKWERQWQTSQHNPQSERLSEELARIRSDEEAAKSANNLTKQLFALPSVNDLARNPLLITMIAATHNANIELPKRRVELYEEMCKLILGTRPFAKNTKLTLTATQNKRILQVLAWHLMEGEITQFSLEQAEEWIRETLTRCCKEVSLTTDAFCLEMLEIAGVLLEKELDQYEFTHQTFQEYFAALHLKEMGREGLEIILAKLNNGRWQEVICFYAALGNADPIIDAILRNSTPETLQLANRCKHEGREVSPDIVERLNQQLQEKSFDSNAEVRLEQRFRKLTLIGNKVAISEPITWGEYQLFLADQTTKQFHSSAEIIAISPEQENQPVTGISRKDARWFCAWLGTQEKLQSEDVVYDYRLPTEEELQHSFRSPLAPLQKGGKDERETLRKGEKDEGENNTLRVVRVEISNRYKALLNYLATGRWRDADKETYRLMITAVSKEEGQWFERQDIENFPCEELRAIDQLWVKYSNGHFGFSVQKQIWLECGGKVDYETECKLGDKLGWRENGKWEWNMVYDLDTSVLGHLPVEVRGVTVGSGRGYLGVYLSLYSLLLSRTDL